MTEKVTAVSIISGFAGAGKTTFLNRILAQYGPGHRIAVVENEFGAVSVDGSVLCGGAAVKEITGGCICCTLFQGFLKGAMELIDQYAPDWILVEPTGVGKLSDVLRAVDQLALRRRIHLRDIITIVDPENYAFHSQIFGDFFFDQLENAEVLVLSRTQGLSHDQLEKVKQQLRLHNPRVPFFDTPWDTLPLETVLEGSCTRPLPGKGQWLRPTPRKTPFDTLTIHVQLSSEEALRRCLTQVEAEPERYGLLIRAKGWLAQNPGDMRRFEYVPGSLQFYPAQGQRAGVAVLIGSGLKQDALCALLAPGEVSQ